MSDNLGNDIQSLTVDEKKLLEAYRSFNDEGKGKVLDTVSDMLQLDRYKKSGEAEQTEQRSNWPSEDLDDCDNEKLEEAIEFVVTAGQASTSALQRRLKLSYGTAARLLDTMEKMGIVGVFNGSKPRQVFMTKQEWYERKLRNE
ncbi:MAG: hypothetical protein J1F03_00020 [Oscillospiraceae bacterium]|nr:hypothetical protein [Oscillospiraceae bacterium]